MKEYMNRKIVVVAIVFVVLCSFPLAQGTTLLYNPIQICATTENSHSQLIHMQAGWPQIYSEGYEDQGLSIGIDSEGNIIVAGYTYYGSTADFLTIKYDAEGNKLWNVTYDSGEDDIAFGLAVDSDDSIIVFGFAGDFQDQEGGCVVLKYSKEGLEQWNTSYDVDSYVYPGDIAVDSKDNVIITGGFGEWQQNMYLWTIKLNSSGYELWNKTYHEGFLDLGLGVAVDSTDNIVVTGVSYAPMAGGILTIKYDENGNILWQRRRLNSEAWGVAIDSQDNVIIAGRNYSYDTGTVTFSTIKYGKNGEFLWDREFDSGSVDGAESVAVDSNDNIIVVGYSNFSYTTKQYPYEHLAIIYTSNGEETCLKRPGINGFIYDVAVDDTDNIFITGTIVTDTYQMSCYTNKYSDITPPSAMLEKPKNKYLYLFDIELLPLPKNTIAVGKLTINVDATTPADVEKSEFYINNQLVETVNDPPFQWTWTGRSFGKYLIRIMVYDDTGATVRDEISILKFL